MCDFFFCSYIISFTFERGTPALQLKEHVMGQAAELAQRCMFLVFVQRCTKCVPTYFFLDSNSGQFDRDLVVQGAS